MNIKDFSLNDILTNFSDSRVRADWQHIRDTNRHGKQSKIASPTENDRAEFNRRGSVTREKINIRPENIVVADDGNKYDRTAPKGTYINVVV